MIRKNANQKLFFQIHNDIVWERYIHKFLVLKALLMLRNKKEKSEGPIGLSPYVV